MNRTKLQQHVALVAVAALLLGACPARADVVTDWNVKVCEVMVEAGLGAPPANRIMAIVHTAVYEAVNAITRRYPAGTLRLEAPPGASVEAAVAAANHAALLALVPSQKAAIDATYEAALARIADAPAKSAGLAIGQSAAAALLALRAGDGAAAGEAYRPRVTAGVYVPTVIPAVPQWPQRKPWLLESPAQFRPGPPPDLASAIWARDYDEVKDCGGKASTRRTAEETAIARFWEATLPPIYHGIVRSVAAAPGREITENARLFATVSQAMDDALIAVMDAKYHYQFWRPITSIRNGDIDGNDLTERDGAWTPLIDTPMHPEYPCAHCILSGVVGTVLEAEIGSGPAPVTTTSYTAPGTTRSWGKLDDFVREVANARIYAGVHYRNSTEVGTAMGRRIGTLAVAEYGRPVQKAATSSVEQAGLRAADVPSETRGR